MTGGLALVVLVLSAPQAKASRASDVQVTGASLHCNVSVDHVVAGAVDVDDPVGLPPAPVVGSLLNQHQQAIAGPDCPARAFAGGNGAASDVIADGGARHLAMDLGATSTAGSAHAEATASVSASMVAHDPGDLFVVLDHVSESFERACSGCDSPPQSGYLLIITVHSAAGDASVTCGTGAAPLQDATLRLPDERCALGADGGEPRLPVSRGPITVDMTVLGLATIPGAGSDPVDGHAFTRASAHILSFEVLPSR